MEENYPTAALRKPFGSESRKSSVPSELLQINKKEFYSNCFSIKIAC
ncbi:hypothetical protein HMPREF3038_02764 [Akkermansia sp. KLE1797]|nr:hypothetical protein HMPREF3038_02764 [Akkermansia sp. KLE1797]KXU53134.1 hypothetical protein HMPREF3039_02690 [Akkermansia sp. KLE1798]KZA03774.1 hypothetical protein HMPREF1326_02547 [Akkermansia sp. KLE1605]